MTGKSKAVKSLSLEKVLDLNEASSLHQKLVSLRGSDIAIDASSVERMGALCAQVLMSAAKSWEEEQKAFTFSKVSDTFSKTMQLIGIQYDHLLAKESKS